MRKLVIVGLIIALVILSSSYWYQSNTPNVPASKGLAQEPSSIVYFAPSIVSVQVGETFTVEIMLSTDADFYGDEVALAFDASLLKYTGTEQPQWRFIGGQLGWIFWVACTKPQSGEVELQTYTFKATAPGTCVLHLYHHEMATLHAVIPGAETGWPIPHALADCYVTVS